MPAQTAASVGAPPQPRAAVTLAQPCPLAHTRARKPQDRNKSKSRCGHIRMHRHVFTGTGMCSLSGTGCHRHTRRVGTGHVHSSLRRYPRTSLPCSTHLATLLDAVGHGSDLAVSDEVVLVLGVPEECPARRPSLCGERQSAANTMSLALPHAHTHAHTHAPRHAGPRSAWTSLRNQGGPCNSPPIRLLWYCSKPTAQPLGTRGRGAPSWTRAGDHWARGP